MAMMVMTMMLVVVKDTDMNWLGGGRERRVNDVVMKDVSACLLSLRSNGLPIEKENTTEQAEMMKISSL